MSDIVELRANQIKPVEERVPDVKIALMCVQAFINDRGFKNDGESLFREDIRHSMTLLKQFLVKNGGWK